MGQLAKERNFKNAVLVAWCFIDCTYGGRMTYLHYRVRKCAIFNIAPLLGDDRSAATSRINGSKGLTLIF